VTTSTRCTPPVGDPAGPTAGSIARRGGVALAALTTALAIVAVIVLSPLALRAFDGTTGVDWNRLSLIGQTYGAASAIVSALALGGVALSLFVQTRQGRADQIQAVRGVHDDLVRMELDDLELFLPCWGPLNLPSRADEKRHIYTTMLMNYAWMGYEIGSLPEPLLRDMLRGMFVGDVARRYWGMARNSWAAASHGSRRGRRFLRIVDDEHARAVAAGPPLRSTAPSPDPRPAPAARRRGWRPAVTGALLGLAGGALDARDRVGGSCRAPWAVGRSGPARGYPRPRVEGEASPHVTRFRTLTCRCLGRTGAVEGFMGGMQVWGVRLVSG
jgi:hypothetical protein